MRDGRPSGAPAAVGGRLAAPAVQGAVVTYIITVGAIYELLLRRLWDPQGAQWTADVVLHTAVPILAVAHWLVFGRAGRLEFRNVWRWLIYPLAYSGVSLALGPARDWYPYPFLDAGALGYARVALNVVMLTAAFAALGLVIVWLDRPRRSTAAR